MICLVVEQMRAKDKILSSMRPSYTIASLNFIIKKILPSNCRYLLSTREDVNFFVDLFSYHSNVKYLPKIPEIFFP